MSDSKLGREYIDPDEEFVEYVYETASDTYRALVEIATALHKAGLDSEATLILRVANAQKQLGHDCLLETKPIQLN